MSLEVECVDRVYLNAYVPGLQVGGQVNRFLHEHLGQPVASPAVIEKIGNRFRREVKAFAADNGIPVLRLSKPDRTRWDDRKLDHVRPHLDRAERLSQFGVVAIVAGQEFQWVYTATKKTAGSKGVWFDWNKTERLAPMALGERIRQLRKEAGWSQADLGNKVGTDSQRISRYENAKITPSLDAIIRIAETLNVSIDHLLIDDIPRRPLHTPENALGDRLATITQLHDEDLAILNGVIDGLLAKTRHRTLTTGIN